MRGGMGKARGGRWRFFLAMLAAVAVCGAAERAAAQGNEKGGEVSTPVQQRDPQEYGLRLRDGEVKPGGDRRVVVQVDGEPEPVVAKVHVEVDDQLVVMLPNGQLDVVLARDATITERPFTPLTAAELGKRLTQDRFKGFKVRSTRNFLYIYNTSEKFYTGTSRILETMYPALFAYCKRQKIDVHAPECPLVVLMFATREEWEQYSGPAFEGSGIVAYYNIVSNDVVVYEQSDLVQIAPELAVKEAISTIAHEGVHQILSNIGVQQRLSTWPMWISEGLPEYFAPTELGANIRWKGVGLPNDMRMYSIQESMQQNLSLARGASSIIREVVESDDLDSDGYAWAWALTHYLATRRQQNFFAYLKDVSELEPLVEMSSSESQSLFRKHFGENSLDELEPLVRAHLQGLPYQDPIENSTHYVAMLEVLGQRQALTTTSPAVIDEWRQQLIRALPATAQAEARFNVQAFPSRTLGRTFAERWANFQIK